VFSKPFSRKSRSLSEALKPPRGFALTKAGKAFFAFLGAVIIVAMLTGNNLLFLILAFLLAFMVVSGIESELNIRHLKISRWPSTEIHAGAPGRIRYGIANPKRDSARLVIHDGVELKVSGLARGSYRVLTGERVFPSRGKHLLGSVKVSTTYPYGLFRKSITFDLAEEVIVFPALIPCREESFRGAAGDGGGTDRESISHVRPYVAGDPLSMVAWKKQARGLATREFQGGGGGGSVVVLTKGGDLEEKLGQAAFLIHHWWKAGRPFGLSANRFFSGMGVSAGHKNAIMRHLAFLERLAEPEVTDLPCGCHVVVL
jgi:uncharacterized protein (DUF58 family)